MTAMRSRAFRPPPCNESGSSHSHVLLVHFCCCFPFLALEGHSVLEGLPKTLSHHSRTPNNHPRPTRRWFPEKDPVASKGEPSNTISEISMEGKHSSNVSALPSRQRGCTPCQRVVAEQSSHTSLNSWQRSESSEWPRSLRSAYNYVKSRKTTKHFDHNIFVVLVAKMQGKQVHAVLVLTQCAHLPWHSAPRWKCWNQNDPNISQLW